MDSFYLGHRDHTYAFSSKSGSEPFRALGDLTWNDTFPIFYPSDMEDLAMTCSDFVNVLKMLICSEKHPVSKANYGYIKKW